MLNGQTETIKAMDHYHTRWNVYHIRLMDVFVQKLGQRKVTPITLVRLSFASEAAEKTVFRTGTGAVG